MANYFRRFLVLKRLSDNNYVDCTVKVECENGYTDVSLQVFSSCFSAGEYSLVFETQKTITIIPINFSKTTKRIMGESAINGFSALLILNGNATPLLYDYYKENPLTVKQLASAFLNQTEYDDYNIATENYYEEIESERKDVFATANRGGYQNEKENDEEEKSRPTILYENDFDVHTKTYYQSIKERFEKILENHQEDSELKSIIKSGNFVKINYDSDRFYSIGKIVENDEVKYLCYAIKSRYENAPSELKKYCSFLPLSPYFPLGEGYYVMFQKAENGELIIN